MELVQAICPYCNKMIKADKDRDAAICPFCLEPYVVEMAIRKYGQVNEIRQESRKTGISQADVSQADITRNDIPKAQSKPLVEVSEEERELAKRVLQAVEKCENHVVSLRSYPMVAVSTVTSIIRSSSEALRSQRTQQLRTA